MPLHYHAYVTVLARYGIRFGEDEFYRWAGMPVDEIVRRLAVNQGVDLDAGAVAAERDRFFHDIPDSELRPVAAVVAIAERYRGRLPMAVATGSTRASAEASLKAIGILDWFADIVSSKAVGRPKPAPDVFLAAAKRIAVEPVRCVAFEDAEAGLQAARAAGMRAVDIRPWLMR